MRCEEHCKETLEKLGKEWLCVHRWLDALAKDTWPWMGHRIHRHHQAGVEEVRHKWGNEAAEAAELHIKADFMSVNIPTMQEVQDRYGENPFEKGKQ